MTHSNVPTNGQQLDSGKSLELQIDSILGGMDPLDARDFDPIEFVNLAFPTEQSFTSIDTVLEKLHIKAKTMDRVIRDILQDQTGDEYSDGGRRELELARQSIQKLYDEIKSIKEKAKHAEKTVQDITKDIKSLDCAKKNLTTSITTLKRLQMLVSAVDQLRAVTQKRQYKEIAILLQAVSQLSDHFVKLRNAKQISDLLNTISSIQTELKRMVFSEFEGSFSQQGSFTGNTASLNSACEVAETLGSETKKQLLDWYCELQLREYRSIFRTTDEVGNLENIARRFAWLKRLCKTFDEEHASAFPKAWSVSEVLCVRFCEYTRSDMTELLARAASLDVKLLVRSLQMTLEFESGLNRRFFSLANDGQDLSSTASLSFSKFVGSISQCFESYMNLFIDAEDSTLSAMMEKFKQSLDVSDDTGVLMSSTDLFLFYRQTMVNLAKLTVGKPFLDLCKLFGKWLLLYADVLSAKIPRDERRPATPEEVRMTCIILNTAEYCQNTSIQLEDKIKEKIGDAYREQASLVKERDTLVTTCVQTLVREVSSCLQPAFQNMSKIPWATLQSVGDQSEYVLLISNALSSLIPVVRRTITNAKHFKWFCDKFVDSFVPVFVKAIHNCKPINEVGAEQMLLDVHAIKTILLELPNSDAERKAPISAVYTKFVATGMAKSETLLKIILTPLEPPEAIIKNYLILCADCDLEDKANPLSQQKLQELRDGFVKILDLKGVKRADQTLLVDLLLSRLSKSGPVSLIASVPLPPLATTSTIPSMPNVGQAAAAISSVTSSMNMKNSVADAGVKLNENLKRFAAAASTPWNKPK